MTTNTIDINLKTCFIIFGILSLLSCIFTFIFFIFHLLNSTSSNETNNKFLLNENIAWHENNKYTQKINSEYIIDLILFQEGIGPNIGFCVLYKMFYFLNLIISFFIKWRFSIIVLFVSLLIATIIMGMSLIMNYFIRKAVKSYKCTNDANTSISHIKITALYSNEELKNKIDNYITKNQKNEVYLFQKKKLKVRAFVWK
ncbi:hypothetical protein BCR32DRAFT_247927 [Anaeromyces robustus]|uniref:ABC transmembrane type-1 domain-containing protein n=1 Tax=Anaeromyces robustus TaxID=1754192 RepID=A0A1Y1WVW9_9FUNG|nr:hypothetical protein BCR32DRAFT_247927 [Anaeromyces robustus]|eukprot:ORX77458.1 hypothetical protein BCR32DRAFT_247927 [Anaeromyces robustus]